ncbi:MBL fold metallo-hydrolase [Cellulosimicrobium protaetiae]|uniref:MBL fold metallo-hydrolase n=1 Tax=Cellulosimicrobium protaetiae TaxID=2587808 RepID=A0A6M5UE05_9MICO|nr:MBL fold metallo-hydrolase [Cellulosimicrobium protaetiae]QJW36817.1 MBL fold metallo-hydrolase [Cellulosimicrobium protaetiae]
MRVTFHGHACVTVRHGGQVVAIDPGTFSDAAAALRDASTVLVTHQHPDHVDGAALGAALAARPGLTVWAPEAVVAALRPSLPGDASARVHAVVPGDGLDLGGLEVVVGGGQHAVIHADVPRIANVTYLVRGDGATLLHPGDSFDAPGRDALGGNRLDVLLAPVAAPWLKLAETIDFVRALDPRVVVPVHDALLSAAGHGLVDRLLGEQRTGGTYAYRPLTPGDSLDVAAGSLDGAGDAAARALRDEHPEYGEVALLEEDETVPPRPEEDAADVARAVDGR